MDPWTHKLGETQGRIVPSGWTPASGTYVLCLGSNVSGDVQPLEGGSYVQVSQSAAIGMTALVTFMARTRGPTDVPKCANVTAVAAGAYTIIVDGTSYTYTAGVSDTAASIAQGLVDLLSLGGFASKVVGAADTVQVNGVSSSTVSVAGSLALGEFTWRASMLVDGAARFSQEILVAANLRDRLDGGALVRDEVVAGGSHAIAFRLELECTVFGVAAELELPAFYVDSVVFA